MDILLIVVLIFVSLVIVLWLGLKIKPRRFSMPGFHQLETENVPLPDGLPCPVERFYKNIYGERIPVIRSAVLIGRGRIRPFGVWLPTRFVFIHRAGCDYRHYIEASIFGIPVLKVNEGYVDSESFFESPMGTYHNDANTNQGANLALWAEGGWFPSTWVTDQRVCWAPVDNDTAILFVPFGEKSENFIVRFDPLTGLVDTMEAMRYREPGEDNSRILWITRNERGATIPGTKLNATGSATWLDQGKPWAYFTLEETAFNVDVQEYIHKRGI